MASEIIPGLWVGTYRDSYAWKGYVVCVLEERFSELPKTVVHVPILDPDGFDGETTSLRAVPAQLDAVADLVEAHLAKMEQVLVCCGQGIERSPLAVVWYLHRKRGLDVSKAYQLVREKRPEVEERLAWLHGPGFPKWW